MSGSGTFRTNQAGLTMSVFEGRPRPPAADRLARETAENNRSLTM
jgi:hypothetical protein